MHSLPPSRVTQKYAYIVFNSSHLKTKSTHSHTTRHLDQSAYDIS